MPIRLPASWRPPRSSEVDAQPTDASDPVKRVRAPRGSREEPRADLDMAKIQGEWIVGELNGTRHRWKCLGYTYLAGCLRQAHQPGWKPDGKRRGKKCPRCWGGEDKP